MREPRFTSGAVTIASSSAEIIDNGTGTNVDAELVEVFRITKTEYKAGVSKKRTFRWTIRDGIIILEILPVSKTGIMRTMCRCVSSKKSTYGSRFLYCKKTGGLPDLIEEGNRQESGKCFEYVL